MESLKHIHQLCVEQLFVFWSFTWFLLGTLCDTKVKGPDRQKSEIWKFWKCESDRLTDKNQRLENFENMSLTDWQTKIRELKFLKTWVWQTDSNQRFGNFENMSLTDWQTIFRDLKLLKIWVWQTTEKNGRNEIFEIISLTDWQIRMKGTRIRVRGSWLTDRPRWKDARLVKLVSWLTDR